MTTMSFATKLAQAIADESTGLLLDATREQDDDGSVRENPGAAFEITSGAYQRYFVTLWRLFENEELFEECMAQLAEVATRIRARPDTWYDTIVTYTATAKHLMEHLHARIETDGDEIQVVYLSPYPFHHDRQSLLDFSKRRVLILADVMATGALAKNLASVVERLGGIPVAALSVIWTGSDPDLPVEHPGEGEGAELRAAGRIEYSPSSRPIEHYTLTTFPIRILAGDDVDLPRTRRINPATILPEEYEIGGRGSEKTFRARFREEETVRQLEDAAALKFGLHEMDSRRFTSAFRFEQLLERTGELVWREIAADLPDGCTVATTYSREDLRFLKAVRGLARQHGRCLDAIYIPKTDSGSPDGSFFMLPSPGVDLTGKHVVLLLSTIHTAEKLQRLVSLLTLKSISGVTIVCLVNRMGGRTNEFITRIRKLLRGVRAEDQAAAPEVEDEASLRFVALHNVTDFDSNDLNRMQRIVQSLTADFQAQTREPSFSSLTDLDIKYFRPRSLTARRFEFWEPQPLATPERLKLGSREFDVRTKDGKLFVLSGHAARTRDYGPLIDAIAAESDKDTLYQLFAILLADVSYLRMARQFGRLRDALIAGIRSRQKERLELERAAGAPVPPASFDAIENLVAVETYLLFGLSLFSYLDQSYAGYRNVILDVLNSGLADPAQWQDYPLNFLLYYSNERVFWTVSMLLHFTHPDFRTARGSASFRTASEQLFRAYKRRAGEFRGAEDASDTDLSLETTKNKIKQNFDSLLREIGVHEQRWKHQAVRYLHRELIEPPKQHNPIIKALENATEDLRLNLGSGIRMRHAGESAAPEPPRSRQVALVGSDDELWKLKRRVEDALNAAGQLEGISEAATRLFHFHPLPVPNDVRAYFLFDGPGSFSGDVTALRRLLQEIRTRETVSREEVQVLKRAWKRVEAEISRPESELTAALLWYITPLAPVLRAAMEDANGFLGVDYGPVWQDQLNVVDETPGHVLIDPVTLKEVMYNLFTNVRHGLKRLDDGGADNAGSVALEIEFEPDQEAPFPEVDRLNYFRIRVSSPSLLGSTSPAVMDAASTIERQRNVVEQFGGTLTRTGEGSFVVDLRLISRNDTYNAWQRKKERLNRNV